LDGYEGRGWLAFVERRESTSMQDEIENAGLHHGVHWSGLLLVSTSGVAGIERRPELRLGCLASLAASAMKIALSL
jgi:hypothetical protein